MSTAQGERRIRLYESRKTLQQIPSNDLFELPGKPSVIYQVKDYSKQGPQGASNARGDMPFLFKAFETGQINPKRLAKLSGGQPRQSTIHEYLDWTVTAVEGHSDDELDFTGFRTVVLLPREIPNWPAPDSMVEGKPGVLGLGAPKPPLPPLRIKLGSNPIAGYARPVCAATIRSGPGYLEVPFVATHESKRGRGYGRCMVEAIEDIARALKVPLLLLCSTNDESVKATWSHLGFHFTTEQDMRRFGVEPTDLVHMSNTVQMHKFLAPRQRFRPVVIRHQHYVQRSYVPLGRDRTAKRQNYRPSSNGQRCNGAAATVSAGTVNTGLISEDHSQQQQQQQQQAARPV